jgi:hypothetical protein
VFSECLPFSNIPHASRLFLDYLNHSPHLKPFYPRSTRISEWAKAEAQLISYDNARRQAVADVLERQNHSWGWSEITANNLQSSVKARRSS